MLTLAGYHITPIFIALVLLVAWGTSGSPVADGISVAEGCSTARQSWQGSEETCSQCALYDLCGEVGCLGVLGNPSQAQHQAGIQPRPEPCKGTALVGRGEGGCLAQLPPEMLGREWGQLKEWAVSSGDT